MLHTRIHSRSNIATALAMGAVATFAALLLAALALPGTAAAAWSPPKYITPQFIPADKPPDVEMDADGDSYFTYALGDGSVRARQYTAAGASSGTQTLTARPTNPAVSPPGGDVPTVAVNAAGDSAYAWLTKNQAATRMIVQARTRSATGVLGPLQTIVDVVEADQKVELPDVAVDADGDAVIAWTELATLGDSGQVKARALSKTGVLGPTQTISSTQQGAIAKSAKVEMQPDGDAVFAWEHSRINVEGLIQTRTLKPAGTLTPTRDVSALESTMPDLAMAPDGDAIFAWQHADPWAGGHHIQTRTMSEPGTLGRTLNLSPRGGEASEPEVALNSSGAAAVAYSSKDLSGKAKIYGRTISATGTLGKTHTLSGNSLEDPTDAGVGISSAGRVVFSWMRHAGATDRVESKTLTPAGALSPVQTLDSGPTLSTPVLAVAASGKAAVVWQDLEVKRVAAAFGP